VSSSASGLVLALLQAAFRRVRLARIAEL
jgi:hypothetical protein